MGSSELRFGPLFGSAHEICACLQDKVAAKENMKSGGLVRCFVEEGDGPLKLEFQVV